MTKFLISKIRFNSFSMPACLCKTTSQVLYILEAILFSKNHAPGIQAFVISATYWVCSAGVETYCGYASAYMMWEQRLVSICTSDFLWKPSLHIEGIQAIFLNREHMEILQRIQPHMEKASRPGPPPNCKAADKTWCMSQPAKEPQELISTVTRSHGTLGVLAVQQQKTENVSAWT